MKHGKRPLLRDLKENRVKWLMLLPAAIVVILMCYIPMGGNRRHQAFNILVVWFLTGMWHGASWNFIIWGLYFGLIVMVEKYTILRVKDRIPAFFLHLYSLIVVTVGWGFF